MAPHAISFGLRPNARGHAMLRSRRPREPANDTTEQRFEVRISRAPKRRRPCGQAFCLATAFFQMEGHWNISAAWRDARTQVTWRSMTKSSIEPDYRVVFLPLYAACEVLHYARCGQSTFVSRLGCRLPCLFWECTRATGGLVAEGLLTATLTVDVVSAGLAKNSHTHCHRVLGDICSGERGCEWTLHPLSMFTVPQKVERTGVFSAFGARGSASSNYVLNAP